MGLEFVGQEEGRNDTGSPVLIRVVGVGGGGCNAVKHMSDFDLQGVELICANTDVQALKNNPVKLKLQLGVETTRGMGAGSQPEIGRAAAEEDRKRIREVLEGADMVFIAAGMGGGTGTGAAPVIAEVAREAGITTLAIVTKPFVFEGNRRMRMAEQGVELLKENVDCLVVIPNERISEVMGDDMPMNEAFRAVDDVLKNGVRSIAGVIQNHGQLNIDFADIKTIMSARGIAILGSGEAQGPERAAIATQKAISSPLLENIDISRATGVLFSVSARQVSKKDFTTVGNLIESALQHPDPLVIAGLYQDESLPEDVLRVTLLATGISDGMEESYDSGNLFGLGGSPLGQMSHGVNHHAAPEFGAPSAELEPKIGQKGDGHLSGLSLSSIIRRKAK